MAKLVRLAVTIIVTPGHNSQPTSGWNQLSVPDTSTTPRAISSGAITPQASMAPARSPRPARRPMMPPKPSSSSDGSKAMVSFCAVSDGASRGICHKKSSIALMAAATLRLPSNTETRRIASRPWLNMSRIVSAVAMPAGNTRPELTIRRGRKYQPTQTPRKLTANTQATSVGQGRLPPVIIARAGIGATNPLETMEAAEDAAVWLILLSSMPQGASPNSRATGPQKAKDNSSAVIDILNDQPILRPE
ncbi:MAG: hypothetical protein WBB50_12425 [Methyloceanibacter sp.]